MALAFIAIQIIIKVKLYLFDLNDHLLKCLLNKMMRLNRLTFHIRYYVYRILLTYNIIYRKNIFDHMGSLHHKPSQNISAEKLFLFKEMIKKTSVTSPTIHYKFLEMIG